MRRAHPRLAHSHPPSHNIGNNVERGFLERAISWLQCSGHKGTHSQEVTEQGSDVARFQITMDDQTLMRKLDRAAYLDKGFRNGVEREFSHPDREPVDVIHHEEVPSPYFTHLVNGHDIGMTQLCGELCLALEPAKSLL